MQMPDNLPMLIGTSLAHPFIIAQPWFSSLPTDFQERLGRGVYTLSGEKGGILLQSGEAVKAWYAVLSGLVKLQSMSIEGSLSVFLGVPSGEWFGEGSVLKSEARRYDVVALRDTELLCMPRVLFDELRMTSLEFNHFLVLQMNRRLGQAMAIIEAGRTRSPEQRVALYLSRLFWHGARKIRLTQEELGHLVGLSRQTVNKSLQSLAQRGLVALEFGRITVLDENALTTYLTTHDA
jgi:CRP/FNR family transcriptional regulator, cyclic AMP receptor protein